MARPKKIEIEEEDELISNEEEEFLTMELEELPPDGLEEEDTPRFSLKQKLILIGSGLSSFLLFLILLFPYENIVRQLMNSSSGQPSSIFFNELSVSVLLGKVSVESMEIMGQSFKIRSKNAHIKAGLFSLLRKKVNGDFEIEDLEIDYDNQTLGTIGELEGHLQLDSLVVPASRFGGAFSLKMPEGKFGSFPNLPDFPFIGKIENFFINKILITSRIDQGMVEFEEFVIDTSVARLDLHGNIRLSDSFPNSQLNLKVCFELERNFASAAENQIIVGSLDLLEKGGNGKCIPITGSFQRPEFKIPGLNSPAGLPGSPAP
ncbi:type II secretion system protein GspN [Leptospira koniambonensis]|uniref:Type II secretion system protein GspN n=1 Tax=Leptospira koniambonensis TaxID=2484950 RepID=A0A4R9JAC8_9LEPT|nr:type II secretion system protein GspN [Leptospira koniambonensis]TGL36337.1 type II secretion system protein GspN [Leptospira koniambonensis]